MVVLLKVLSFFASPLGKITGIVMAVIAAFGATYVAGDQNGAARIQARWNAAELAAIENARKSRIDSERAVTDGLPDDRHRRD